MVLSIWFWFSFILTFGFVEFAFVCCFDCGAVVCCCVCWVLWFLLFTFSGLSVLWVWC